MQGDRWSYVAILPESGFIHAVHHGKRTLKEAEIFINKIKARSNGRAPLFLSDGWFYQEALYNTYCIYEPVPYSGRGRPRLPLRIVNEGLKYAQVVKYRDKKGKLLDISTKIVKGTKEEIFEILNQSVRSKTINTSFVESRNGKYRKDNKRLTRKTICHSKKPNYHDVHADFLTTVFNFCRQNAPDSHRDKRGHKPRCRIFPS